MFCSWPVSIISFINGSLDLFPGLGTNCNDSGVDKGCQDFPQPFKGRKLGETLDLLNTSAAGRRESQGLGPVPGGVSPYHTDAMNITLASKNSTLSK